MSHASWSREDVDPVFGRGLGADLGALLHALLALDAEADQRGDLAAELDRLVLAQVAEVRHFHLALCVLVYRERVDHAHGVALTELLQLLDDLAVELRMLEPQHQQLNRSDRHLSSFVVFNSPRARRGRVNSRRAPSRYPRRPRNALPARSAVWVHLHLPKPRYPSRSNSPPSSLSFRFPTLAPVPQGRPIVTRSGDAATRTLHPGPCAADYPADRSAFQHGSVRSAWLLYKATPPAPWGSNAPVQTLAACPVQMRCSSAAAMEEASTCRAFIHASGRTVRP